MVQRRGAYYQYGDIKLGQGRAQATQSVRASPGMEKQITAAVMAVAAVAQPLQAAAEADDSGYLSEGTEEYGGFSDGPGARSSSSAFQPSK